MKKGDKVLFDPGDGEHIMGVVKQVHRTNRNLVGFTVEVGNTTHSYYGNNLTNIIEIVEPA